jgi:hypothetical protein
MGMVENAHFALADSLAYAVRVLDVEKQVEKEA